jgi:hypothetical protein
MNVRHQLGALLSLAWVGNPAGALSAAPFG